MNVPIERMPYAAHELYMFPWFPHLGRVLFALLSEESVENQILGKFSGKVLSLSFRAKF